MQSLVFIIIIWESYNNELYRNVSYEHAHIKMSHFVRRAVFCAEFPDGTIQRYSTLPWARFQLINHYNTAMHEDILSRVL